jgi:HEAT repeat protein
LFHTVSACVAREITRENMKRSVWFTALIIVSLALSNVSALRGQEETKPATAPATPSSVDNDPTVMLLRQGHSEGVRATAARNLGKEGNPATIPALAGALSDPSAKVRREVVLALGQFHQADALPPLIQATKDLDGDVRALAVQSLVGYYTGVTPSTGVTGFFKKSVQRVKGHFEADDTRIDPGTAVAPQVIAALVVALKDTRSEEASRLAARGLGTLLAKTTVPDLVAAAHSSDEDLAREALNALTKIKDLSAGPRLVDLLDSPDKDVKRDACVTVGILRTNEALPKLQSIFESSPDQKDRIAALQGLAYLGQKVSVPLFTKALWSEDKNLRQAAAEGLARAADPQSLGELEKAVTVEKDAPVKLAIEFAITALGKQDYLSSLVNELGSKTRGDTARAYLTELARDPAFLPRLYPYLQSQDADVRKRLCTILMYSGDQSSLEPLDRLSHDPDNDVAAQALRATRAIRARLQAETLPPKS